MLVLLRWYDGTGGFRGRIMCCSYSIASSMPRLDRLIEMCYIKVLEQRFPHACFTVNERVAQRL